MTDPQPDKHSPFSCGSQYADWEGANCIDCKQGDKGNDLATYEWGRCPLRDALSESYMGDGYIDTATRDGIGANPKENRYIWFCPSRKVVRSES